jgi:hypothetical protein
MKRTSDAYRFTVDPDNSSDLAKLQELRLQIRDFNKMNRTLGYPAKKLRVIIGGRWGKQNPESPAIIRGKGNYSYMAYTYCPKNIAVKWDIYVTSRY